MKKTRKPAGEVFVWDAQQEEAYEAWQQAQFPNKPLSDHDREICCRMYAVFSSVDSDVLSKAYGCFKNKTFTLSYKGQEELIELFSLAQLSPVHKKQIIDSIYTFQDKAWSALYQVGREGDVSYRHALYESAVSAAHARYNSKNPHIKLYRKKPETYAGNLESFFRTRMVCE